MNISEGGKQVKTQVRSGGGARFGAKCDVVDGSGDKQNPTASGIGLVVWTAWRPLTVVIIRFIRCCSMLRSGRTDESRLLYNISRQCINVTAYLGHTP